MFIMQLSVLRYLLRQGIAIRGHHNEEGNFMQLMETCAEGNFALQKLITEGTCRYQSPDILNKLISIMGNEVHVLWQKLNDMKEDRWFDKMRHFKLRATTCIHTVGRQ